MLGELVADTPNGEQADRLRRVDLDLLSDTAYEHGDAVLVISLSVPQICS